MKPHAIVFALMTFVLAGCAVAGNALHDGATMNSCRAPGPHDAAGPLDRICSDGLGDEVVAHPQQTG